MGARGWVFPADFRARAGLPAREEPAAQADLLVWAGPALVGAKVLQAAAQVSLEGAREEEAVAVGISGGRAEDSAVEAVDGLAGAVRAELSLETGAGKTKSGE